MAANQPVLLRRSMVEGLADQGILPSGQVAAAIERLESAPELIASIVEEARGCFEALLGRLEPDVTSSSDAAGVESAPPQPETTR